MAYDVITFGSAVVDVFVGTDILEKRNAICYPAGSKILIKDLRFDIGGGGTNTAVAFSRLGFKTGWIGKIGKDKPGQDILDMLKKENIKFLGKVDKNGMTGYSVILDSKDKTRTVLTYKGVNNEISLDDISKRIKTKWLYYSSFLGKSFETQKRLARIMIAKGTKLAFNPSMYLIKRKNLSSLLKICEVLVLNKEEAQMLLKKSKVRKRNGDDLLINLSKLGPRIVVITDKNRPIQCYNGKKKYKMKPHPIKVVERTGAGDAFASGFVAGLIADKPIEYCLSLGLKQSESVIRHFGAKNKLLKMKITIKK
jgi:ribokinase